MYQIRPRIQASLTKYSTTIYCTQVLIPEYERQYGPLPRLYYEPRGTLYEPHGGIACRWARARLPAMPCRPGTSTRFSSSKRRGCIPSGRRPTGNRYDMAIIASNGFGSVACRRLLERASQRHGCQVFVLHDADDAGYNIARTLAEETQRMPGHRIDVIDLGLTFEDGLGLGITPETYTRDRALPAMGAAADAAGTRGLWWSLGGRRGWICERIELNALSSPQLIASIEQGLARHEATAKVVPPQAVLQTRDSCER